MGCVELNNGPQRCYLYVKSHAGRTNVLHVLMKRHYKEYSCELANAVWYLLLLEEVLGNVQFMNLLSEHRQEKVVWTKHARTSIFSR